MASHTSAGGTPQLEYAERGPAARAFTLFGLLIGGVGAGALSSMAVASDSELALLLSCAALPFALITGLSWWLIAALGIGGARLIGSIFVASWRKPWDEGKRFMPPGSWLVVATGTVFSAGAAIVVAIVSTQATLVPTLALYTSVGAIYGIVAWRLARLGFLSPADVQ